MSANPFGKTIEINFKTGSADEVFFLAAPRVPAPGVDIGVYNLKFKILWCQINKSRRVNFFKPKVI